MIWTVAKKELRGYFNSAVAVIFLTAFLVFSFYTFFWQEKFFARGLADLRPLFEWMPKLLIVIVSALAMRLWADERRAGTLEVLLTLPVPRWKLVAGKFVAGMLLIAVALGLTLALPIAVSQLGNLDPGPVIGGYLAALLLSAAYLSIGMCVSAATDNQIVAFVGTAFLCAIAYAIGGDGTSAIGRAIGTGARFESVARGVLDLRDLAYYGSITVIGVALNVLLLGRLTWGHGARARARRVGAILGVALIAANAIALNVWLAPAGRARIDLTADRTYSLSDTTRRMLRGLDERLLIRGYFSEKTHPLLAPLVPQIRDLLDEYRAAGGAKVRVEVTDPTEDKEAKAEAKERYGVGPIMIPFASEKEKSVINAYFSIVVEYGDQHEVIQINDLLQIRQRDIGDVEVSLRNLEYEVTKSIKKVVTAFSSLDSLFASAPGQVKLIAYLTPKTLPTSVAGMPDKLKKVADELVKGAKGKLAYSVVAPKYAAQLGSDAEREEAEREAKEIIRKYGVQPRAEGIFSDKIFYYGLVLEVEGRPPVPVALPMEDTGEAAIRTAITEALKRAMPGFRKVVGLWTPPPLGGPQFEGMPQQQMPPPQAFQYLQRELSEGYELRPVRLDAKVPDSVDVLVLAGPAALDAKAAEYVDQFVMRGGALVVLDGRFRPGMREDQLEAVTTGLESLFDKWGIKVDAQLVVDPKCEAFVPIRQEIMPDPDKEVERKPLGLFVRLTDNQLDGSSVITNGLPGGVVVFASPVTAEPKVGDDAREVEVLLRSSGGSWLTKGTDLFPDPLSGPADQRAAQPLAVAVTGSFPSGFAKPVGKGAGSGSGSGAGSGAAQLLERSPPSTRIVVFGSSSFVSDAIIPLAQQLNSDLLVSNLQLVHNAIDWAVSDTDLLGIRARTSAARAISVEADKRDDYRNAAIIGSLLMLAAVVGLAWLRRRAVKPVVATEEV